jgi:hypothetical protein
MRREISLLRGLIQPLTLGLALGAMCAPSTARAGVYGWWPLDDGQGDVARDLSSRKVNATIFGATDGGLNADGSVWVNDPHRGTVLGLAGNSAWVSAGTLPVLSLDSKFSWSFWARQAPGQSLTSGDILLGNRYGADGADTDPREFIKFTPDRFEFHVNATGNNDLQYGSTDIPSTDIWMHHAVVKQAATLTYLRNGEVINTGRVTRDMLSADPLPFAMGGQNGQETWRGYLSDVQLYESALTSDEVRATMNGNVPANRTPYARWKLNDGKSSQAVAKDSGPRSMNAEVIEWETGGLAADGSAWVNDPQRGTVLGLAGETAWVSAGELPMMSKTNDFTWSFWARQDPGQATPANDIILGNRFNADGVDTSPREFIKFTPDRFEYHMNANSAVDMQYSKASTDIPSNDKWMQHIVVKDGPLLSYYRDGVLANQRLIAEGMSSTEPLPFGLGGQNGQETWKGYLSDVRLFDHALTSTEIGDLSGTDLKGDYNRNGSLDAADLDLQAGAIVSGANPASFDLNSDSQVNLADRLVWVNTLKKTWIGDSDLNGVFNTSDFVTVFQAGKFEIASNATWGEGDWDGNQRFNSSDFVVAFQEGGYEAGPRAATQAVPEPSSALLLSLGLLLLARRTTVSHARTAVRSVA